MKQAVHVVEHHMHKNDVHYRPVQAAAANAATGKASDGSEASIQVFSAGAAAHGGYCGGGAALELGFAAARAEGPGIPGTGGLGAPFGEAQAANAKASAKLNYLGAKAGSHATAGRVEVGLQATPLTAGAEGPAAAAAAGFHVSHIGAYAGVHIAEAHFGPFAVRAGLKVGAGIENGIPVVHTGPTSMPCSIM